MSKYETTFVIDSLKKSDDQQNTLSKVQSFIKNNGGEIDEVEEWGKRRLAYEINRKQYGNYYQIHFDGPTNLPGLLEREYRLEETVLRFLTIKSHAKAAIMREKQAILAAAPKDEKKAGTPETKSEAKPAAKTEAEPETRTTEAEPETRTEAEPETETVAKPATEPEAASEEPESAPVTETVEEPKETEGSTGDS